MPIKTVPVLDDKEFLRCISRFAIKRYRGKEVTAKSLQVIDYLLDNCDDVDVDRYKSNNMGLLFRDALPEDGYEVINYYG